MQKVHVSLTGDPIIIQSNDDKPIPGVATFSFPTIFDLESTQNDIYSNSQIMNTIKDVVQKGLNGTVFAYGQTGSGKTFTMYGDEKKRDRLLENKDGLGIVQRSVLELFKELAEKDNQSTNDQEEVKNGGLENLIDLNEDINDEQDVIEEDSDDAST